MIKDSMACIESFFSDILRFAQSDIFAEQK